MIDVLRSAFSISEDVVLGYFLVLNSIYLVLVFLAAIAFVRQYRRVAFAGHDDIFANPLTPGVSILVPAHNEEAVIVDSVRSMLALRYPAFEVVVVDDGSTDGTFAALDDAFDLRAVPKVQGGRVPTVGRVLSVHAAGDGSPLLVVRKESNGRRADALNAALDVARQPLVCMVDADTLLEEEALLRIAKPFVDDPDRVVAAGGVVRAANGCQIDRGRVVQARVGRGWLTRIQVVEYLRSFLLGRTGWSKLGALLVISGAFGVFRRDLLLDVGGLDSESLGEDAELVTRVHRHLRERGSPYRIVFVSEPICWTEVPSTLSALARQRRRWSQGLGQILWQHRRMVANPQYGRLGAAMVYFLLFELLGAVVEVVGLAMLAIGLPLGLVDPSAAWLYAAVAVGYGLVLSMASVTVEVFTFRRYRAARDLAVLGTAALAENVGFRQLHAWWRLQGLWRAVRRRPSEWGPMPRVGFSVDAGRSGT